MNRRHAYSVFLAALAGAVLAGYEIGTTTSAFADSLTAIGTRAGHLTINRLPNLGGALTAFISIDGVSSARIGWGQSYHGSLAPGDHFISIMVYPNHMILAPAEKRVSVQSGQSYMLTLKWNEIAWF
jgi:hypothetical protein